MAYSAKNVLKIGWLPFAEGSASSRLRAYEPVRVLRGAGMHAEICDVRRAAEHDIVVFQKVYGEGAEKFAGELRARGKKVVFDMCDNYLYCPFEREDYLKRKADVLKMCRLADLVTVSSRKLERVFSDLAPVRVVPDMPEPIPRTAVLAGKIRRAFRPPTRFLKLVWFGSGGVAGESGLEHDLGSVIDDLNHAFADTKFSLTVISNSRKAYGRVSGRCAFPLNYVEWHPQKYYSQIASHDIAIIPFRINPYTECKTSNRIQLAFRLGLGVIATPIESYLEFSHCFLHERWEESLRKYSGDRRLLKRQVETANALVGEKYSEEAVALQWLKAVAAA